MIENLTLDYDEHGIWLVVETFEGDHRVVEQMGHVSWITIAAHIQGYLPALEVTKRK